MVTNQTYWIVFISFLVLLNVLIYTIGKKKKSNIQYLGLIITFALAVVNKWIFPNVYIINSCGSYEHKIMLMPQADNNMKMSLGKHSYILNRSAQNVTVETIIYGTGKEQPDAPVEINGGQNRELPFVAVDYMFEEPPQSVRTKQKSEKKRVLYCSDNRPAADN